MEYKDLTDEQIATLILEMGHTLGVAGAKALETGEATIPEMVIIQRLKNMPGWRALHQMSHTLVDVLGHDILEAQFNAYFTAGMRFQRLYSEAQQFENLMKDTLKEM